jgi:hypothetical protein
MKVFFLFFWNKATFHFLVEFLSFFHLLSLGRFWQFWVVSSRFGADFAALAMANTMPKLHLKSYNLKTFEPYIRTFHAAFHLKLTNGFYLYFKSNVHWWIIASVETCLEQHKVVLASIDV